MMIVFLGPPGAGKGTQAATVSKAKNIPHISSGNLLRESVEGGAETGKKAQSFIEKGLLVPDEIVVAIIKDRIVKSDCKGGFVLDGFPRTLAQAKVLDGELKKIGSKIDVVFYFAVSKDSVVLRLSGRLICSSCGANYHVSLVPPQKTDVCDKCGSKLCQRSDDKRETVLERLRVYQEQTEGLIDYYKKNGILKEVSSEKNIDDISKDIFLSIK